MKKKPMSKTQVLEYFEKNPNKYVELPEDMKKKMYDYYTLHVGRKLMFRYSMMTLAAINYSVENNK